MTELNAVELNRLAQTRAIIRLVGSQAAFAERLGVRNSYINQIAGQNPVRAIGDKTAANIERAFGLAPGALDSPAPVKTEDGTLSEIVETLAHAGQYEKELVLSFSHWIVERSISQNFDQNQKNSHVYDIGCIAGESENLHNPGSAKTTDGAKKGGKNDSRRRQA